MKKCDICAFFFGDESVPAPRSSLFFKKIMPSPYNVCADVFIDNDGTLFLSIFADDDKVIGKKKIKYCPMCGKRLVRKAGEQK